MTLTKKLKKSIAVGALALAALFPDIASAGDIFFGVRGPTDYQADARVVYSNKEDEKNKEKRVDAITNQFLFKYWDGDDLGKFMFVDIPYKLTYSSGELSHGLGNISAGIGPRGRAGSFNFISYLALEFPTDESKSSGLNARMGAFATYFMLDRKMEIDGSLECKITGQSNGKNPPNEIPAGLVVGGRIFIDEIRAAAGITALLKDNSDYLINSRAVIRYMPSQAFHFELIGDAGIKNKNIPQNFSATLLMRYNL